MILLVENTVSYRSFASQRWDTSDAQYNLGVIVENANPFVTSICEQLDSCEEEDINREAFRWYLKAAAHEYSTAWSTLGEKYLYGLGVRRNKRQAEFWIKKAADYGNKEAINMLLYDFN